MKIVALSDIHSCLDYLEANSSAVCDLEQADLTVISGDITNFGGYNETDEIISHLQVYNENVLAVPGNCDLPEADRYLRDKGINLNCNCIEKNNYLFTGIGGFNPCSRHDRKECNDEYFQICLDHVADRKRDGYQIIFVCHFPPFLTLVDRTAMGKHGGVRKIREFIEEHQPLLSVTGHIHEGVGIDKIVETTLVNPGSFRQGSYAVIEMEGKTVNAEIKQAS
jgi:uncharacterized protein